MFKSRGCAECHGGDGRGVEFINDGEGMRISGPNITLGGPAKMYTPEHWARIIRHGLKATSRAAFIMPSED